LDFFKGVGIGFGWRGRVRVDGSILHRVDPIVVTEPLCLFENSTQHRLNVLQAVPRQVFLPDLVKPLLYCEGADVFQLDLLTAANGLDVMFPYIVVAFLGARFLGFLIIPTSTA